MTFTRFAAVGGRLLIGQIVHLGVLLWPTFVFGGGARIDGATVCFAGGITAAAALECLSTEPHFRVDTERVQDRLALHVAQFVGCSLLAVFWLAQIERITHGGTGIAIQLAGAAMLALGTTLRIVAIRTLGSQFVSDIRRGDRLVCEGIYAWLRHPSEVGLLLFATGPPLLLGSTASASAAAIVLVPVSLWRMRCENTVLAAADE